MVDSKDDFKLFSPQETTPYAYVFALFKGDSYLPGVLVMAHSIRITGNVNDIVCMVTNDVSQAARELMISMDIIVTPVPYIDAKCRQKGDIRDDYILGRYLDINIYQTKWNCLNLTQYNKILLLDVDMSVCKNIDNIFEFETPSGVIRKVIKSVVHKQKKSKHKQKTQTPRDIGRIECLPNNGNVIPPAWVESILHGGDTGVDGGCMLLTPNSKIYNDFVNTYLYNIDIAKFNSICGDDEIALFDYLRSKNQQWRSLSDKWSCIEWRSCSKCNNSDSYIMNFIGIHKPWNADIRNEFSDTIIWYACRDNLHMQYPGLLNIDRSGKTNVNLTYRIPV